MIKNKKELSKLQREYIKAKAKFETLEKLEQEIKNKILANNIYTKEDTGERITDCKSDFLMSDSDFKDYLQKIHKEALRLSANKPNEEYTFTWEALTELKQAENNILNWVRKNIVGKRPELTRETIEGMVNNYKYRQQLIDLTVRLEVW